MADALMADLPASAAGSNYLVLSHQVFFVLTGLGRTFASQQLVYSEGSLDWMLMSSLVGTLGPGLLPLFLLGPARTLQYNVETARVGFVAAILDAVGMITTLMGLKYAGSGLTMIIYASLPAMTAIMRFFFHGVHLSRLRVFYMGLVIGGLALVPLQEGLQLDASSTASLGMGLAFAFLSTFLYALLYVYVESNLVSGEEKKKDPLFLMFWQSLFTAFFLLVALGATKLYMPEAFLSLHGVHSVASIAIPALVLWASSGGHSFSWIRLLESSGSTATGLLQSVRSSMNLVLSALLFCDISASQCLSLIKVLGAAIVLSSLFAFNSTK